MMGIRELICFSSRESQIVQIGYWLVGWQVSGINNRIIQSPVLDAIWF